MWTVADEPELVIKTYFKPLEASDRDKLATMCRLKSEALAKVAAWPLALLSEAKAGAATALLMPIVKEHQSIHQLYGLKSRLRFFPEAQFPFLLHVAANTARAFATIHAAGQVIGDVNFSNLMVGRTGTVSIIDCDSFQIADGVRLFNSPVGSPDYTPPELQGVSFIDHKRTVQHDAFGLAVLTFQLLFLGRHPFMGVYDARTDEVLTSEKAIATKLFPYALSANDSRSRLPSFAVRLDDFPAEIGALYRRAFVGEYGSRPAAQDWVQAYTRLAGELKQCTANANHHYSREKQACPWCRFEGAVGAAVFGIKLTAKFGGIDAEVIWSQIVAIQAVPEVLERESLDVLKERCQPDPDIEKMFERQKRYKQSATWTAVASTFIGLMLLFYSWFIALVVFCLGLVSVKKILNSGKPNTDLYLKTRSAAATAQSVKVKDFETASKNPIALGAERVGLSKLKAQIDDLPRRRVERLKQLEAEKERKQKQHFLEKFRIEDEVIEGISAGLVRNLKSSFIDDAWDIDRLYTQKVKGIGPVKQATLLSWRRSKEKLFKFDASQPLDPRDLHALEAQLGQELDKLTKLLVQALPVLQQIVAVWAARRKTAHFALLAADIALAAAEVNAEACTR